MLAAGTERSQGASYCSMNAVTFAAFSFFVLATSPAFCRPPAAAAPMRLRHWAQLPVRVYLPTQGPGQTEEAQTALAGFDEWVKASRGRISFVRVSDASTAEIIIQFVPGRFLTAETRSVGTVGETTVYSSNGVLKKALIRLAEGAAISGDLQTTAAHEFGHALGISGHSADPDDLMYPVEINHFNAQDQPLPGQVPTVTAHDLRLLQGCYPGLFGGERL